jgi:hypothetical protein
MKKPTIFLILSITFLSINCFSQSEEATIFFKDGDSIQGYGLIKNNKIKFRVSLNGKSDFWTFRMVEKIEFETFFGIKIYEYIKLNKDRVPILMELITKGEVSLYRQTDSSWVLDTNFPENNFPNNRIVTNETNFLVRKNSDYTSCLNCGLFNKWKKRTIHFLIDCPTLVQKIKKNEFREIHLKEIVEYYNDFCTEF